MNSTHSTSSLLLCLSLSLGLSASSLCSSCGHAQDHAPHSDAEHPGDHTHEGGEDEPAASAGEAEHAHDEVSLGTVQIGDLAVELAQGHGVVTAGSESHLVVKLPYSDGGATVVRAWLGGPDRTLSYVGRGEYAAEHDDYDVHATAPDPLPEGVAWWIEIQRPEGTKHSGSAAPLLE